MYPVLSEEFGLYEAYTLHVASYYVRILIAHKQYLEQNKELIAELKEKFKKMLKSSSWSSGE